jgi:predicted unusual protein kinase regulating ubiquinone biosynthesis (AarF/ABC1/UbiB family)
MADSSDEKLPPQGRFQRFRKLATLSAQLGTDMVGRGVRRMVGGEAELLSRGAAEKLVATLGDLKGMAMKFGQAVSMDPDLLTPELRAVVSRLQNQAPPMGWATVARVVEEELGAPPDQRFAHFERAPMAAASLGQVHRARLADGREVAVKVQYPGVAEGLQNDLQAMGVLVKTVSRTSRALDGTAYFRELQAELLLELDYLREARLARELARATAGMPELKVPAVVDTHTAARVLTLELLPGRTLKDFAADGEDNTERFRVSRLLVRATYGPFFRAGLIHGDPHPGNFLVMPDGRLGLLDFGSIKHFAPHFVDANRSIFLDVVRGAPHDVVQRCREAGFTWETPDAEVEPLMEQVFQVAGRSMRSEDYDYAADTTARDLRQLFATNATRMLKVRPPPEGMFFFRSTGGLALNLKLLGARGDFRAVYHELAELAEADLDVGAA